MRKGKIKRPPGAKEPIIRLVGNAEAHLIHDEEQVSIPNTRKDWDEILYSIKVFKRWLRMRRTHLLYRSGSLHISYQKVQCY